jgi:hypothetical protein
MRIEQDSLLAHDAALPAAGAWRLQANDGGRIDYLLAGGALLRQVSASNTGAGSSAMPLLDGVTGVSVELWQRGRGWLDAAQIAAQLASSAAPPTAAAGLNNAPRPAGPIVTVPASGVRVTLQLADGSTLQRVFLIGAGA